MSKLEKLKMDDAGTSRPPGMGSNISTSMIARAVAGVRSLFSGPGDWFGPGAPQPSSAPPQVTGRQFDLPIGVNMVNTGKTDGLSFASLRQFADACEIVRLLIETRKDQVCNRPWSVKVIEGPEAAAKPKRGVPLDLTAAPDPRLAELTRFLRRPDKAHTWSEWLRMLLEDLFVLDAPTLYIQRTNGPKLDGNGPIYALRPIDGGTIKKVIDIHGWVPEAPAPAYQQILKGIVASSFTTDDLIYKPRNVRTNRIYGYSQVEQIVITARQWLSRQASNLEYYESGNLPEGFIEGAPDWTPEQLKDYQDLLDSMLAGNYANKRKARVVPNGSKYTAVKEPALKQEFDEWLARIACFCFSVSPTPFIKQMNRATSESAQETASEEGVEPITNWIKEMVDDIIQNKLGYEDIEFVFEDKEAQDPVEKAAIDVQYINANVLHADEVRAEMGLPPLPPPPPTILDADGNPLPPPPGQNPRPSPVGAPDDAGGARKPAPGKGKESPKDKAAKLAKAQGEPADIDSKEAIAARKKLGDEIVAALELTAGELADQISKFIADGQRNAEIIANQLQFSALDEIEADLTEALTTVAKEAGATAVENLGASVSIDLVNERAVDWASKRSGELIKSDAGGGELADATRAMIRADIEKAIEEGWSNKQLAKELESVYAFSKSRAMTIARTELAMASIQGNMAAWVASGVVHKKLWLLSNSEGVCEVCKGNTDQGAIPLMAPFESGDLCPPSHPNCRCSVAPITSKGD